MQRDATAGEPPSLPPQQIQALAGLLAGQTVTASAEAAGVDRTTVHRWLREDFGFQAALNRGRREIRDAVEARLLHAAEGAAEAVSDAIQTGDTRTALAVLRGLGLLDGQRANISGDDPHALRAEADLAVIEAEKRRRFRELSVF
jgi:hypothetical protein